MEICRKITCHADSGIYRSCDVIVKLSYVEGMFGPPLEMFHCGGTSIVYDVTGHDEYIVHGKNGLVAKKNFVGAQYTYGTFNPANCSNVNSSGISCATYILLHNNVDYKYRDVSAEW